MDSLNKQREQARRQREADWKTVLSTPEGLRVLGYLLAESGWHGTFFGGPDTHFTAYHEGRRSMGQFIVRQAQVAAPNALAVIVAQSLTAQETRPGQSAGFPSSEE